MMNNYKHIFTNIRANKPLFIVIILFISIVILSIIVAVSRSSLFDQTRTYNDPLSGETVYNPKNRTPETYNQPLQPTFLGFTDLIDRGVSFDNSQYFKSELVPITIDGEKVNEVSIDVDTIKHTSDSKNDIYTFGIRFNRKYDYQATLTITKVDETLTYTFSGPGIEKLSFN